MTRGRGTLLAFVVGVAACAPLVLDGTSGSSDGRGGAASAAAVGSTSAPAASVSAVPRMPSGPESLEPSRIRVEGTVNGRELADIDGCARCHADAAAHWRQSAHALASFNNPIYRLAVDKLRRDLGPAPSRFCAGCHDVSLFVDGVMEGEVKPDDPRAHTGVSCRLCHSISEVRLDGNGSYTLTGSPIPIPVEGDAASVKAHVARVAPPALRSREFCLACHKTFLHPGTGNPFHLAGQDDATPWMRSAFAGSHATRIDEHLEAKGCPDCHMGREEALLGDQGAKDGNLRSHRFLGGHTYLAGLRHDQDQLRRARAQLEGAASLDVTAVVHADGRRSLPADAAPVVPGEAVQLSVVVRNTGVGHRFPGGVVDAQDTWIELVVRDAHGKVVAEAGVRHEREAIDPTAHVLRAVQVGNDGQPLNHRETHLFRAVAYNHTIAPRDAEAVEYSFTAPGQADAFPLQVTGRLRHRSRTLELQEAACADARAPRGQAFLEASRKITGTALVPCAPQPLTDIARVEVWIGPGSDGRTVVTTPTWRRLHDHGLGLLHAVQERLDEARPSLERALALAPGVDERAQVLGALATVAARQGRVEETEQWLAQATALGLDPAAMAAVERIRGEALSQVWRWGEATGPLGRASALTPLDDGLIGQLALAYGSSGQNEAALEAARRGLALQPRDPDLLRVQALSLGALGVDDATCRQARDAYLACRTPDDAPGSRARCSRDVPNCALERNPVHTHVMRVP